MRIQLRYPLAALAIVTAVLANETRVPDKLSPPMSKDAVEYIITTGKKYGIVCPATGAIPETEYTPSEVEEFADEIRRNLMEGLVSRCVVRGKPQGTA
jgi:hypothetical protein